METNAYFDAFSVHDSCIHLEYGGFNGTFGWQLGHSDVDGVGSLGIQDDQFSFLAAILYLLKYKIAQTQW